MQKFVIFNYLTFILYCLAISDFGKFDVRLNYLKTCQGPKHRDCCDISVELKGSLAIYDFVANESITPSKAKVVAMAKNRPTVRLQMSKPCDHIFMKPFFKSLFNATDTCTVLKGHYRFNLDYRDILKKYYRGQFLYGNWTFKSILYGDKANFICIELGVELYPAKE